MKKSKGAVGTTTDGRKPIESGNLSRFWSNGLSTAAALTAVVGVPSAACASEADLVLPDFASQRFLWNIVDGRTVLLLGLLVCVAGILFGVAVFFKLKNL
ncbi:MAG: hypothetical protein ACRDD1_09450, partial [Planctomycetia bacterium]